jgi:hypothetical protein
VEVALGLLASLAEAESLAERLEEAAYSEDEPGLAYTARVIHERIVESRGLLEAVLDAHGVT